MVYFRFVVVETEEGGAVVRLIKRKAGEESLLAEQPIGEGRVHFKVEAHGQDYSFYVDTYSGTW